MNSGMIRRRILGTLKREGAPGVTLGRLNFTLDGETVNIPKLTVNMEMGTDTEFIAIKNMRQMVEMSDKIVIDNIIINL
jgi:hypothetical protein